MSDNEVIDGHRAKELLADPVLIKVLNDIEDQYIDAWRKTADHDIDARERLYQSIQSLEHIRVHLRVMAEAGKLATAHIERLKGKKTTRKLK